MKILKNSTYDTLINRINDANRERDVYQKKWSYLRDDLGDTLNKLRRLRAKTLDPLSNEKILITGNKGSGKTTLCLDIVKKLVQRNKYDKIFWLNPYDDFRLKDEEFYINAVEDTGHVEIFKDSHEFLKIIEYSYPSKPIMFIIDDPIFEEQHNKGISILSSVHACIITSHHQNVVRKYLLRDKLYEIQLNEYDVIYSLSKLPEEPFKKFPNIVEVDRAMEEVPGEKSKLHFNFNY